MQATAERMQGLFGAVRGAPGRRRVRWDRQGILLAVILGHGVMLGVLSHVAGQHLAWHWGAASRVPAVPLATTLRLVVQLLPLASGESRHATQPDSTGTRSIPNPVARPSLLPQPRATDVPAALPPAPTATAPTQPLVVPEVRVDDLILRRAMQDADAGTVRDLAKRAGRLDQLERLRADPLAERMASAATSTLREGSQARVADDAKCKQELGKSGVGERSHSNDRDTFMSSYIGSGKECKK